MEPHKSFCLWEIFMSPLVMSSWVSDVGEDHNEWSVPVCPLLKQSTIAGDGQARV